MSKLLNKIMTERRKLHIRNLTMMSVSLVLMGFMAMWVLTGCSMFTEEPEFRMEPEELDTLCCIPDPVWPHSCDGWILCAEPIQLKEIEE